MKGKYIALIVILILVVVGIIYRKKIMLFFNIVPDTSTNIPTVKSYGQELTQEDIDCGGFGGPGPSNTAERIIESCTKPKYRVVGSAKQKSFRFCPEADCDLNLDACVSTIKTPDGKVWYYNYQSGDKCIYIDNTTYAF